MNRNYLSEMNSVIEALNGARPKLLLHSCCAPCSTAVIERLHPHFSLTVFFYNPNMDTEEEYSARLSEQKRFLQSVYPDIRLIDGGYDHADFLTAARGLRAEREGGARCEQCFRLRFRHLAGQANIENVSYIASTLTVSPKKNAETVNRVGEEIAEIFRLHWLPSDFKKEDGYLKSVRIAEAYGLYRQNYCGCEFSKK